LEYSIHAGSDFLSISFIVVCISTVGVTRPLHSWQEDEKINRRESDDSGEYTMPRQFTNKNEAVYAVLEQEGMDVTTDERYLDVIQ
jgi:hypothetical protein